MAAQSNVQARAGRSNKGELVFKVRSGPVFLPYLDATRPKLVAWVSKIGYTGPKSKRTDLKWSSNQLQPVATGPLGDQSFYK